MSHKLFSKSHEWIEVVGKVDRGGVQEVALVRPRAQLVRSVHAGIRGAVAGAAAAALQCPSRPASGLGIAATVSTGEPIGDERHSRRINQT